MSKIRLKTVTSALLCSLFILTAFTVPTVYAGDSSSDATVQSYEAQLAEIERKKQQALEELKRIENEQSYTYERMQELDKIIEYNSQQRELTEKTIDRIANEIIELNNSLDEKTKQLQKQSDAFYNRMVDTYMDDETDYIELILGSVSLQDFLSKLDYVNAIFDYDKKIIEELKENKETLRENKEQLDATLEKHQQLVADFEERIKENQVAYDQKLNEMEALRSNEKDWTATYEYNRQQEQALDAELKEYLAELQRKSQSQYVGGAMGWPLDLNASYHVSSEQGWRDLYGVQDYHLGIDLAAPYRTEIYAANSGTVLRSEKHWSYGNYVLIDHGGGKSTLYAHMDDLLLTQGQTVTAGQLVGHIGLTGNTFGYHLHFEVRENGEVVNPRGYLNFP